MMFSQSQDHKIKMEKTFILNINVQNPLTSLMFVVISIPLSANMFTSLSPGHECKYKIFIDS